MPGLLGISAGNGSRLLAEFGGFQDLGFAQGHLAKVVIGHAEEKQRGTRHGSVALDERHRGAQALIAVEVLAFGAIDHTGDPVATAEAFAFLTIPVGSGHTLGLRMLVVGGREPVGKCQRAVGIFGQRRVGQHPQQVLVFGEVRQALFSGWKNLRAGPRLVQGDQVRAVGLIEVLALGGLLLQRGDEVHLRGGRGLDRDCVQGVLGVLLDAFGELDAIRPGGLFVVVFGSGLGGSLGRLRIHVCDQFLDQRGIFLLHGIFEGLEGVFQTAGGHSGTGKQNQGQAQGGQLHGNLLLTGAESGVQTLNIATMILRQLGVRCKRVCRILPRFGKPHPPGWCLQ
ncbi:hypothetical protein SBA4_5410011 [Candidatus Sulfopaludibacter sp. SbA4]|nr:hypothetical protein SBA4_5410011 [Candidatus Sulfopaludibacter sp. SbA4]